MEAGIEAAVADLGAALYGEAKAALAKAIRLRRRAATLERAETLERQRSSARPNESAAAVSHRLEDLARLRTRLETDRVAAELEAETAATAWRRHRDEAVILEARLRRRRAAALLSITL